MQVELLDQLPPHAVESERAFIDALIGLGRFDPDIHVRPDQPYDPSNRAILEVMSDLDAELGGWDNVSLIQRLQRHELWGRDGFDAAYVASLSGACGNSALIGYHAKQIIEAWRRRIVSREAEQLIQLSHNGFDVNALQHHLDRIKDVTSDDGQTTRGRLPEIEDDYDLCAIDLPLPEELVQGLLHRGSKLGLGAPSKGMTTWAMMNLGLAVAYGRPWLGCCTTRARVLFINLEIQKPFSRRRSMTLKEAMGVVAEPRQFDIWNLRGYATSYQEIFPAIIERVRDGGYWLIILDPIYKLYGAGTNENGAAEVAGLLNAVEELAVETGAAVAYRAHYSKGNQAAKEAIDRVSGSGVFARDPDSLLNFTRHQEADCYTVEATLRNFPPMPPFVVRWNHPLFERDVTLNPAELKVPGKSSKEKAEQREQQETEQRNRLLRVIKAMPDGDTARSLRTSAGLNPKDFGKAMSVLLQDKRVEPCRVKKHTRTEDGYRVTQS
jgi:hypothetical protein